MDISDRIECLFSSQITKQNGSYVVTVPEQELDVGHLDEGETYRVAVLPSPADNETTESDGESAHHDDAQQLPEPPVEEGETRTVEIENIGDQGDGITRVERGFVVIVPDTREGERVRINITDVRKNVAFAEVTERLSYYE